MRDKRTERGQAEGGGALRLQQRAGHVAAGQLGAAADLHHWAVARARHQPQAVVRRRRLARRRVAAQR